MRNGCSNRRHWNTNDISGGHERQPVKRSKVSGVKGDGSLRPNTVMSIRFTKARDPVRMSGNQRIP